MSLLKKNFTLLAYLFISQIIYSASRSGQDLIPVNHWVYKSLHTIELESKTLTFSDRAPLSISEFSTYFSEIDYDKLSEPGKKEYERIQSFLDEKNFSFNAGIFSIGIEPSINPEFYISSDMGTDKNEFIPLLYDYTKKLPLIDLPIKFSIGDYLSAMMGLQLRQSRATSEEPATFFNDFFDPQRLDCTYTHDTYLSAGYTWDNNVGINLRNGLFQQVFGYSFMPSAIQSEYLTDTPNINLRIFSPLFAYDLNITQFTRSSYLYTHMLEFRLFKIFEISFIEGVFVNDNFDLRYINPLAIFHGMGLFYEYPEPLKVNSLFSLKASVVPIKNMRIYVLYTQNEHQLISELQGGGTETPEGFAVQPGIEYKLPLKKGYLHFGTEAYYASPFLYIKDTPMVSFARIYRDICNASGNYYYQWMGNPLGPDTIAAQVSIGYDEPGHWSLDLIYNFVAKGEFGGDNALRKSGWDFYSNNTDKDLTDPVNWPYAHNDKRSFSSPSGTPEFTNSISLKASICPIRWLTINIQPSYIFVNNFKNMPGINRQSFQLVLSTKIELIKIPSKELAIQIN